jgi:aminopeptidase
MVNFALGGGKGIKKGDVVRVSATESGKPLFTAICNAIVKSGGHVISNYAPDDEQGDKRRAESFTRFFYDNAKDHQLDFFPEKYLKGIADQIDHSLYIASDADPHALKGVDPKKIMRRGVAMKPYKDWLNEKEWNNKFTWTICLYGTPAMAKEAGLSEKDYWNQIIKACFLDEKDPIKKWKEVYKQIDSFRTKLNKLSPQIDKLHAVGEDMDLWITLGEKRNWLAGSGRNIPSFEIFTSPDWRGTNGWIRFNQPLYRYGSKVEGIQLWFKDGSCVKARLQHPVVTFTFTPSMV